jgi:hypothetical protein
MASIADRFADDITLEYSLIDRMRIRGHIMNLQNVGMLGSFFQRFRGVSWIEQSDLEQITADFVGFITNLTRKHQIPLLSSQPKESHVDEATAFLEAVAHRDEAIYAIIKVQEETSSFVSYVPKKEADKTRKIARGRRRVNHFYFFIKDRQFGFGNSIRLSSYAPFTATVCFNGHNFVAQQLRNRGVEFQMRDNLFVQVADPKAFQRACEALTPEAIERFANHWVYRCINLFSPAARQAGFHYQWYIDQVEWCHNLIFSSEERLNTLFGRLLDSGRAIGQPHVLSRLFQRRLQAKRTGGRIYRTSQEDYCLKAWHKKTYIKQYNKQGAGLRTETCTHDVREFGMRKALQNLPYLLRCLGHCNQRLLRWQDTIDQTTVSAGWVEKLGQPTVCATDGRRVPGIHLHNQRLTWLLAAVFQFTHVIDGFGMCDLVPYVQRRFGLSPDEYTAVQARYDLRKFRAKGWVNKLEHRNRYVLTPKGIVQGTAILKLKECLNGTVAQPIEDPPKINVPQSQLQKAFRRVRAALGKLLETIGLKSRKGDLDPKSKSGC